MRTRTDGNGYQTSISNVKTFQNDVLVADVNYNWYNYPSIFTTGWSKTIRDYPGGSFKPGSFRVNPVEIMEARSSGESSRVVAEGLYWGSKYRFELTGTFWTAYMLSYPVSLSSLTWDSWHADQALSKAYASAKSPDADVGVMLGELGETIELLREPFKRLGKELGRLNRLVRNPPRRGPNGRKRKRPPQPMSGQAISDAWLLTRFGILPLLSDIDAIRDLFTKKYNRVGRLLRTGSSVHKPPWIEQRTSGGEKRIHNFYFTWIDELRHEFSSYARIYYEYGMNGPKLGLSPWDWPSIVYEVTPFSFLVDYVFNFDAWIRTISPDPYFTYLGNCVTQTDKVTWKRKLGSVRMSTVPVTERELSSPTVVEQKMKREVNLPIPELPVLSSYPFDLVRSLDMVSLLWSICFNKTKATRGKTSKGVSK